ncbi:hypothetical protein GPL21_26935 [Bradyrhizobium pachyrhizi]|uniref:Uncharacterized protein n=1 Tax=Bradyrhizobium pachyrhizi TaxID=280333 RepID=A0A844SXD8_9BRAD|nr:hypothetical protein [Bradyrhizobium pachyrhizi]
MLTLAPNPRLARALDCHILRDVVDRTETLTGCAIERAYGCPCDLCSASIWIGSVFHPDRRSTDLTAQWAFLFYASRSSPGAQLPLFGSNHSEMIEWIIRTIEVRRHDCRERFRAERAPMPREGPTNRPNKL